MAMTDWLEEYFGEVSKGIKEEYREKVSSIARKLARGDIHKAVDFFQKSPAVLDYAGEHGEKLLELTEKILDSRENGRWNLPGFLKGADIRSSDEAALLLFGEGLNADREYLGRILGIADTIAGKCAYCSLAFFRQSKNLRNADKKYKDTFFSMAEEAARKDTCRVAPFFERYKSSGAGPELGLGDEILEKWIEEGKRLNEGNPEGLGNYLLLQTKESNEALDRAIGGLPLKSISKILKPYIEGLSGKDCGVRSLRDLEKMLEEAYNDKKDVIKDLLKSSTTDGKNVYLPERVKESEDNEDNFDFYKVSAAHQAGRLEFGTFDLDLEKIKDVTKKLREKHGKG